MYDLYSEISRFLGLPLINVVYSSNIAIIAALFMGFVGSISPCQISANIGAISYFSNRYTQQKRTWIEIMFYLLGKITVYSAFGILVWAFGQGVSNDSVPFFVVARKLFGPLMIVIGLYLFGLFKLPGNLGFKLSNSVSNLSTKVGGKIGAYLMGVAFSLGFCPTMVWLFFGLLMPLTLSSSIGVILPPIFAIGTAMPLILFILISIAFGLDRLMIKKVKSWGRVIQRIAGALLILIGISDTITYWTL